MCASGCLYRDFWKDSCEQSYKILQEDIYLLCNLKSIFAFLLLVETLIKYNKDYPKMVKLHRAADCI